MSEAMPREGRRRGPWAVVAGSAGGVGREIALRLAEDGYAVVVCGRDSAGVEETRKLIEWTGGLALDMVADLGDCAAVRRLATATVALLDGTPVEVLVNNAGEAEYGPSEDKFDAVFNPNVKAPLILTDAFAPLMAARGRGTIVNVAGLDASAGVGDQGLMQAARAALIRLTKMWMAEYGPKGVRVNTVDLGRPPTPADARRQQPPPGYPGGAPASHGGPGAVAEAIRFLVATRAASIVTMTAAAGGAESFGCPSAPG
ncbi:SDR family NAD(P)-dependent oxidoreductase [Nocardia sp. NPDC051052]|uniref:SDR family NAD(P)-dependent oxidoreductase n=1 Tax=Nocardia sp. NPDC051052 TaxID=3364322 RepID=UPI00379807C0